MFLLHAIDARYAICFRRKTHGNVRAGAARNSRKCKQFRCVIEKAAVYTDRLAREEFQIGLFSHLIGLYRDYVEALIQQHAFADALDVADSSRARILSARLRLQRTPGKQRRPDYRRIAKAFGSTFLYYWIAPVRSYLWVITPGEVSRPLELPGSEQIQRWVDAYRDFTITRPSPDLLDLLARCASDPNHRDAPSPRPPPSLAVNRPSRLIRARASRRLPTAILSIPPLASFGAGDSIRRAGSGPPASISSQPTGMIERSLFQ